jgi:hypothetical protein
MTYSALMTRPILTAYSILAVCSDSERATSDGH